MIMGTDRSFTILSLEPSKFFELDVYFDNKIASYLYDILRSSIIY